MVAECGISVEKGFFQFGSYLLMYVGIPTRHRSMCPCRQWKDLS